MIDLKSIKCSCGTVPTFGLITDKKATCCSKCKTPDMVNIKDKLCQCGTRPTFGNINDKTPVCCVKCKTADMIDLIHEVCICGIRPVFGLENDKIATCCVKCKTSDMINIIDKKCKCGKSQPIFGFINDKIPLCCVKCKTPDMIDIKSLKCPCGTQPIFGLENDKTPTCCKKCKTSEMIDIINKRCPCGTIPSFGLENDTAATCCVKCKSSDMINIKDKKCKANEQGIICTTIANKKYKNYCTHCFAHLFPLDPLTFQIRCKTKEIATRDFINSIYEGFKHDKPLWIGSCDCTHKRRIDHYYLLGNTLICVETDEFQHKGYNKYDEEIRYDDLMMVHGGKFIFIRFNPDKYKENGVSKNPTIANRLRELSKEIDKQIKRVDNDENTELVEIIKMYYDN
jgi:hypothetical protein